jgi:hypothetical protein
MQPGSSQNNLTPSLASMSMVNSVGASGGKKQSLLSQISNKAGTIYVLSVSSLVMPTLENLVRMCVEHVITKLLALSSKVIRTYISKVILGFLPPYPLLTGKNEESKSKKTKHNHLEFITKP